MEIFSIITNISLVLIVLFFFYFVYTLLVLANKKTVTYIKAKCPDYWSYDDTGDPKCVGPYNSASSITPEIILSNYSSDCDKYNYSKTQELPWSGISNNYDLKNECNNE